MICPPPVIQTERLSLREWQEVDVELFAQLNADPRVMQYFPRVKTAEESLEECQTIVDHFKAHGYGLWAVSENHRSPFIGFIGLRYIDFHASFTPTVEVGWRLAYDYWGKGYATEGARASLHYGFEKLKLPEIVSFTSTQNLRSRRVMEKIGMHHHANEDFDHPKLPKEHWLSRHVLYRLTANEWHSQATLTHF